MLRLDRFLVEKGYFTSRTKAWDAIHNGFVFVNDSVIITPAYKVNESSQIRVIQTDGFVSRGGNKLKCLLDETGFSVEGKKVLDVGTSTGGFCDCLLQYGAEKVVAIDVGTGQFHASLVNDSRVELHEKTDVRQFVYAEPFELITVDLSFISAIKILYDLNRLLKDEGDVMLLFKPQFEQKERIKVKGGIIKRELAEQTLTQFVKRITGQGWMLQHATPVGNEGKNYESMLWLRKKPGDNTIT